MSSHLGNLISYLGLECVGHFEMVLTLQMTLLDILLLKESVEC